MDEKGQLNTTSIKRLEKGLVAYQQKKISYIIVTGGNIAHWQISVAEKMAKWLITKGISPANIFMETCSFDTLSNLENSLVLINHKLNSNNEILCISSPIHLYRIQYLAKRLGYNVKNLPNQSISWSWATYKQVHFEILSLAMFELLPQSTYNSLIIMLRKPTLIDC